MRAPRWPAEDMLIASFAALFFAIAAVGIAFAINLLRGCS